MTRFVFLLLFCLAIAGCTPPPSGGMRPSSDAKGGSEPGGDGKTQSESGSDAGGGQKTSTGADTTAALTAEELRLGGVRVAEVKPRTVPRTLAVPSQVMTNDLATAHIATYTDGRVVDVIAAPGDRVRPGQVLAHLHSHIVHETVGALATDYANERRAQAAVNYAQAKRDRYVHLYGIQAASLEQRQTADQELVQAQTDLAAAGAAVIQERAHLADVLQISDEAVTPDTIYTYENVPIKSPIAGTVLAREITPGGVMQLGDEAFAVTNLSTIWDIASVNQADLGFLRVGQRALVRTDAWPGETFEGRVTLIGAALDPATRTVQVRIALPNAQGKLKPQMFSTATIDESTTRQALFVPQDALQTIDALSVVFVTSDGRRFSARTVRTAAPVGGEVEVVEGLRPGEHVAVAGAFMLKSALLKSTIGDE